MKLLMIFFFHMTQVDECEHIQLWTFDGKIIKSFPYCIELFWLENAGDRSVDNDILTLQSPELQDLFDHIMVFKGLGFLKLETVYRRI